MNKYEISIWEDKPVSQEINGAITTFLSETKLAVIGSDTMHTEFRALSPNLIENINGTHTFTFNMQTHFINHATGELQTNPFIRYLFNERKIKVKWNDKWYDLVIKKSNEDSNSKTISYTCTDLFINELSKSGYNLEFNTQLQNNIGTVAELAEQVLQGSSWQYNEEKSTPIIQKAKGPVYETTVLNSFSAVKQSPNGNLNTIIPSGKTILVFYDSLTNLLLHDIVNDAEIQFLYSAEDYQTDINESLVINGDCYSAKVKYIKNNNTVAFSINENDICFINLANGVSKQYTGERLVRSQVTVFDAVLNRYSLLCKDNNDNDVYEIIGTEYIHPTQVINLIANPKNFINTEGWINNIEGIVLDPPFTSDTDLNNYTCSSYLKLAAGWTMNVGIQANLSYFTPNDLEISQGQLGGIQKGEQYVLRAKIQNITDFYYINNGVLEVYLEGNLYPNEYNEWAAPIIDQAVFNIVNSTVVQDEIDNTQWIEINLICNRSLSAEDINNYALFIHNKTNNVICRIAEIQFFKYVEGATSYLDDAVIKRINPGEVSLLPLVKQVYKYYQPDESISVPHEVTFLYVGETESDLYTPQYNNYEKMGTINIQESNRFNILQTIAETFQAWVHFEIEHEEDGSVKLINGVPQKFVYFTSEVGKETGLVFEYGLDLKTISREINSDNLATKVIVKANNNEYAQNGFCSIARSTQNYTRENFIINLDYYLQQHLLDKDTLQQDLYSTSNNYIGYYYYLSKYNTEYDDIINELLQYKNDQLKLNVDKQTYELYLRAAQQGIEEIKMSLISLSQSETWEQAQSFIEQNKDKTEIMSLLNAYGQKQSEIQKYESLLLQCNSTLNQVNDIINTKQSRSKELVELVSMKHKQFNDKYGNYLMEGTWQSEDYIDDTKYYLDALDVAYTSSKPQVSYTINVLRLNYLEPYSSKVFNLGDICYVQDAEFFGYLPDGVTPYKEKILVNQVSYFFDDPSKDSITVQNYKTKFDSLFQRITATTQSLQYSQGAYKRAAAAINSNGSIDADIFKTTLEQNSDLVINSANQHVIWDDTGITISDKNNSANKTRIIAGGLFITNDGGETWKNAINGNGISADVLTAGRINTNEITIYNNNVPSFRWDSRGLMAYRFDEQGVHFDKYVCFNNLGLFGYWGNNQEQATSFSTVEEVMQKASFALTWDGFKLSTAEGNNELRISTQEQKISIIETKDVNGRIVTLERLAIGKINNNNYGIIIRDADGNTIFSAGTNTLTTIGNCIVTKDGLSAGSVGEGGTGGWELKANGSANLQAYSVIIGE